MTAVADTSSVNLRPREIQVGPLSPSRLEQVLDEQAWTEFQRAIEASRRLFARRVLWNINSTAVGGGVAEMLRSFTAYSRGAGINARWMVMSGDPKFFRVTKRLHNLLHGHPGDGEGLDERDANVYEATTQRNVAELMATLRPEDVVVLHDPQTAGLIGPLKEAGTTVVWRSHIGTEVLNEHARLGWEFLAPYLRPADAYVFSRRAYVPPALEKERTEIIPPSIDAFSPKNQSLDAATRRGILSRVGLIVGPSPNGAAPSFTRHDGTEGRVDHFCELFSTGPPPNFETPLVVQVSRWDRLKDPCGVMLGFAEHCLNGTGAHLVLAGPTAHAVADDPEMAGVLDETEAAWRALPHAERSRVHLACLPMLDNDENAVIVNALQRQATVVVQKSIEEGFGLTVAEAMWKSRPVVASAVGGVRDQIEDGVSGVLLDDPRDLHAFSEKIQQLLADPELARAIGRAGRERTRAHFLDNRRFLRYKNLLESILE